jgi:peptidoglycan hydrolase-like protein with peptidoglycan-binding domain
MPMPDPSFGDPRERLLAALLAGQEGAQPLPEQPAGGGSGLGRNLSAVAALALGVLPATRLARAMFATAPRAIGTGLGTGLAFETAAGRGPLGVTPAAAQAPTPEVAAPPSAVPPPVTGPEPGPRVPGGSERVYQLQEELTREGYYTGRIDGRMGEGGPTERAKALRDAERDRQRAEAMATSGAEADRLRAEAEKLRGQAEAARVTQEGERGRERAAAERAGEERMAGVPSRISSRLIEALGTYGPIAGYIGGSRRCGGQGYRCRGRPRDGSLCGQYRRARPHRPGERVLGNGQPATGRAVYARSWSTPAPVCSNTGSAGSVRDRHDTRSNRWGPVPADRGHPCHGGAARAGTRLG